MRKVLLFYKSGKPKGEHHEKSHIGLGISAFNAAKVLRAKGIDAEAVAVFDGYELEQMLREINNVSTVVIYAPWIDMKFIKGLCQRWPGIQFTITIHSNIAFLQSDPFALKIIREGTQVSKEIPNFVISANCIKLAEFIRETYFACCPHLPNLYYVHDEPYCYSRRTGPLKIGLFGAVRQLKNMLTGVAAGILLSHTVQPVHMYINGGRVEGGEGILKAIGEITQGHKRFTLKEVQWLPWQDFTDLVRTMDVLFQPSFSESFNNVTADGAANYIPSVVSPAITWAPEYWRAEPDNVFSVAEKAVELLGIPQAGMDGNRALRKHNALGLDKWLEFIVQ